MIFCHFTFAQVPDLVKEMVENYLQIRQKPESDRLLQEYLSPLNAGEDTLYAILYSPQDCPRCEVAIPNFYQMLKKAGSSISSCSSLFTKIRSWHPNIIKAMIIELIIICMILKISTERFLVLTPMGCSDCMF